MNKIILRIKLSLLLFYGGLCGAQEVIYELTSADVTLIIKPNICVAARGEEYCISSFDISWYSKRSGDFCLGTGQQKQTLKCWEAAESGFYVHKINISKDQSYWLTSVNAEILWARSTVKYAALKPHRKNGRRSRSPWSIQVL